MKKTPEQELKACCAEIRKEVQHWKDINQNGCNDPFWTDGCNMNLTRNHIIYYRDKIRKICEETILPKPAEWYYALPPEVDNGYMAHRRQKDRINRLKITDRLTTGKYEYNEEQISMF